jgi:hypothetical protein
VATIRNEKKLLNRVPLIKSRKFPFEINTYHLVELGRLVFLTHSHSVGPLKPKPGAKVQVKNTSKKIFPFKPYATKFIKQKQNFEWTPSCSSFVFWNFKTPTSWSILGPGVEVGLMPNCMKCIHIFPILIVGSFYFIFLPSKLDVQCMVIAKKEQNKILFQNPFKLMFNKYNKQCKVGEGHFNSYFIKTQNFIRCNDFKSNVCFNIVVGFGN